ncbi:MAG: 16S rRNA (cytidine(1402)-2'-O)-methyltransferase [Chloroflexota bacterium]|nr:16S rRNA (cytidine(1402)-2'-O)-methyltransferase [Chloroflexota bacterium]
MPGTLYVVATPIGNLEDLTLRAARVLGEVALVAAEDTRSARVLLRHIGASPKVVRSDAHAEAKHTPRILAALEAGQDVALVTDAGAPGVSDPGAALVRAAADAGYRVSPLPGPSAVTAALAAAGVRADRFRFLGFPPRNDKQRADFFRRAASERETLVLFEAPHRLRAALYMLKEALGDRRIVVCRELSKVYEEVWRGTLEEAHAYFAKPRGEFTIVIEGAPPVKMGEVDSLAAFGLIRMMKKDGATRREAAAVVAERHGVSRREAYRLWLRAPA